MVVARLFRLRAAGEKGSEGPTAIDAATRPLQGRKGRSSASQER